VASLILAVVDGKSYSKIEKRTKHIPADDRALKGALKGTASPSGNASSRQQAAHRNAAVRAKVLRKTTHPPDGSTHGLGKSTVQRIWSQGESSLTGWKVASNDPQFEEKAPSKLVPGLWMAIASGHRARFPGCPRVRRAECRGDSESKGYQTSA
jgi:hypothetical protein